MRLSVMPLNAACGRPWHPGTPLASQRDVCTFGLRLDSIGRLHTTIDSVQLPVRANATAVLPGQPPTLVKKIFCFLQLPVRAKGTAILPGQPPDPGEHFSPPRTGAGLEPKRRPLPWTAVYLTKTHHGQPSTSSKPTMDSRLRHQNLPRTSIYFTKTHHGQPSTSPKPTTDSHLPHHYGQPSTSPKPTFYRTAPRPW